jgi:hypothetical protein
MGRVIVLLNTLSLPRRGPLSNRLREEGQEFSNRAPLVKGEGREVSGIAQDNRVARVGDLNDRDGIDLHDMS